MLGVSTPDLNSWSTVNSFGKTPNSGKPNVLTSIRHTAVETGATADMRLVMHTVICCCVLIVFLPLGNSVTGDANTGLKKRLRVWLQTRMKRDLHSSLGAICEQCSDVQDGPEQNMTTETLPTSSSFGLNVRSRRSAAKSQGCFLITCAINVLIHRLNHYTNHKKQPSAPKHKVDAGGYGRRRRRSLLDPQAGLRAGQRRWRTDNRARTAA